MSSKLPTVAFHIGAHKTATSHLQRCLANATEALAGQGVRYFGPSHFRKPGQSVRAVFGLRDLEKATRIAPKRLHDMADGADRVVLSEENYVGPLNDPDGGGLLHRYPDAAVNIASLAAAIGRDIDVFLALRHPTHFLNSGYCQMLLGGTVMPFAQYRDTNPASGIDWARIVSDLRAASGVRRVTVWRYEDYAGVFAQIIDGLVGQVAAAAVPQIARRINVGLSQAAVTRLLQEAPLTDRARGHQLRGTLPISDAQPRFDGFTAQEHATGTAAYAQQIAQISQMDGITLLRPEID